MTQRSLSPAIAVVPVDNPDWDHARTPSLALRAPEAEWSHSSLTERLPDGFDAPGSDFSYQGLLCLVHRENWKFLDRMAFQVRRDGLPLVWVAGEIEATPEAVTYRYADGADSLDVTYTLLDQVPSATGSALVITYALRSAQSDGVTLHLKPVLDIRHMYGPSDPARHRVNPVDAQHLTVVNTNKWLALRASRPFEFVPGREQREVSYRLGKGERHGGSGQVLFRSETYKTFVPGELRLDFGEPVHLVLMAGTGEKTLLKAVEQAEASRIARTEFQRDRLAAYFERFDRLSPAVVTRIYVMAEKFGMPVGKARLPEAGGWWFRTPWFRNVFEGYLHNHRTLRLLGKESVIEDSIRLALQYQEPILGRFPNRLPEVQADQDRWEATGSLPADYYVSSDATTLLFTLVAEILPFIEDEGLLAEIWRGFKVSFAAFKASRLTQRNGCPVLLENGLLVAVPSHSWINGKRVVWAEGMTVTDLPIRCPANWQIQDILTFRDSHYAWEQYQYPTYYLPEINAQWLRMLVAGQALATRFADESLGDELAQIAVLGRASYKHIFWNPHAKFLYNMITLDRRIDGTPTSTAIEAAALLGEPFFSHLELEQIWQMSRNRLLVKRGNGEAAKAFGVLVKDSPERIFYDNQQYHEAVVWPRETPYLVRLLRMLGQEGTIKELLDTNLAHQMDEAMIFYNSEILSLPEGINVHPNPGTEHDPVPVKNPMQWWSQWCDAYLTE